MTPERWKKLDALFHEALELQGEARAAHLAKVCGDDERLREEADRLIAAHERDGSFIDSPIFVETEKTTDDGLNEFPVGRRIGPYRVVSLLGRGGMGNVFLAEDTRLERKVAIKVLPAIFTQNPERVRRFEREAKSASALNHPNILTIHEIGEADGAHYIVSEFVEGHTLREQMRRGRVGVTAALDVAGQVASRLMFKLNSTQEARLAKRYTSNPAAYEYYTKAMYHFSNRNWNTQPREESDQATALFKQAIDLDSNYALAHAQLGYAYAWTALNFENNTALIERAKREIETAEKLDPQLPEVHVARSFIFWSQYEGWQVEAAIRELRLAQQFDRNVGHFEQADIYGHIGLDEQHEIKFELALEIDPTSSTIKQSRVNMYYFRAKPDEGLAADQRLFNRGPDGRYYLEKRMIKEAEPLVIQNYQKNPDNPFSRSNRALLLALQGKHQEAEAAVPAILEKASQALRGYHHLTYNIARIYALGGRSEETVKWLRETAMNGMPDYTLFVRDTFLDRIRQDPAFVSFMAEMKTRWEGYRRAFG